MASQAGPRWVILQISVADVARLQDSGLARVTRSLATSATRVSSNSLQQLHLPAILNKCRPINPINYRPFRPRC